jgi:hypothetical protein
MEASDAIGSLEVASATGGDARKLDEPAYVHAYAKDGLDSIAARVLGLRELELDTGDPLLVDATMQSGPFHALLVDGDRVIDGNIRDLPDQVRIELSTTNGTLAYDGSAPIGEITVEGSDPNGFTGRATDLHLLARDIRTSLDLAYAGGGNTVSIDAGLGQIGLFEVQLTSGPDERVQTGFDGILLNDLADRYVLFARITGLRKATAVQTPAPDLTLDATGNKVFKVDVNQQALSGGKITYTRATLDRLQRSTRVQLIPTSSGQRVTYSAAAATNSLTFDTNSGNRWNLHASLASPLPASMTLCQASNNVCGGSGRSSNAGSVSFVASEHTTANLFDCVQPANSSCPGDPDEFLRVTNLRARKLVEDANSSSTGSSGHIYLDTDNHELTGNVLSRDGSGGFEANFPSGFRSENRLGTWSAFGLFKNKSGTITCPGGTSLAVYVIGIRIGVTSFLC